MSVEFEEENQTSQYKRHFIGGDPIEGGFLMKMIIKSGLAKDKTQANYILLSIAGLFLILTLLVIFK